MKKIINVMLSLFILSVLLAGCSKDEMPEPAPETEPAPPYELRLTPPWTRFESDWFEQALEEGGDKSVFSKTILISGGTGPYRIVPEKERYILQDIPEIDIKMTDYLKITTECVPGQQDRIIVELLRPDILLVFPPKFTVYDKNGGCAKFHVFDDDLIVGP